MQARLSARDLACRRGERLLFRKLTLDLGPGDMLHVRGPNGVGKTSLMRILAGLARPFAGEVERTGEVGLVDGHVLEQLLCGFGEITVLVDAVRCGATHVNFIPWGKKPEPAPAFSLPT